MIAKIAQASEAGRRIFELLDRPRDLPEPRTPEILRPMRKHLEFKNVSFTYPETEKLVLDKIDLHVEAGQTVALIGESGSGKSTLVDLMARFFDPTEGSIRIDGHDIRDFRITDHRSRIGIVQQQRISFFTAQSGRTLHMADRMFPSAKS
jgi:ABC-type multidrug transport system fused ATPase/permease subunit